jgi:hypothetical protein
MSGKIGWQSFPVDDYICTHADRRDTPPPACA